MGLPEDAYDPVVQATPTPVLDYSDPIVPGTRELIICFGTQFESNMMGRSRWLRKLTDPQTTLVVVDPIPDPFTLSTAALVIPAPPHVAATKVYQNGEWRLSLSLPRKRAAPETRTDPTIVYDAMAAISRRLREEATLRAAHPDLARHAASGYLQQRFEPPEWGGGLLRMAGEVSRPALWERVLAYMAGGEDRSGPLYCRPEHADGQPITWEELLAAGSLIYGGVGTTRYRLDYDTPDYVPFHDVFRRPGQFTFFGPTEADLVLPEGIILNSGRSTLSDDKARIRFAMATFNSGKATPAVDMPEENRLYISPHLAEQCGLRTGEYAQVTNLETGEALTLPVEVSERVLGDTTYISFHKCRAEVEQGRYVNTLTSHTGRCPYTAQANFKATRIALSRVEAPVSAASAGVLANA
jgi:anaerobic selenocysteine-containing dehydrogenase